MKQNVIKQRYEIKTEERPLLRALVGHQSISIQYWYMNKQARASVLVVLECAICDMRDVIISALN